MILRQILFLSMMVIKIERRIQNLLVVLCFMKANADTILVHFPELQNRSLKVITDTDIFVESVSECAAVCDLRNCDVISYHEATSKCTTAYSQKPDVVVLTIMSGIVYRKKENKTCLNADYEYVWDLDICIQFYYLHQDRANWENSRIKCQSEAGDLLTVDSEEKEILFLPYINNVHESTGIVRWWIGANDSDDDGQFQWVDGSSLIYTNWDSGQPDNFTGIGDSANVDCAQYFYRSVEKSFAWFDTKCDTNMAFICESKLFSI